MDNLQKIKKCLNECNVEITENGELVDIDSMKFIECIISLEEEFKIEIPYEMLDAESFLNITNIEGIVLVSKSLVN